MMIIPQSSQSAMLSPRFIPQSVFYTHGPLPAVRSPQSAVRSPQSAVRSPQSAVRSPQSAVRSPQSAVRSPQSAVRSPQSAVRSPQSAVRSPQSAVRSPQSAVRSPQSTVRSPQSTVRSPQPVIGSPQSMFYTDRNPTVLVHVNRHKRCLCMFRRYARRRAFITKTWTIILFMNTTLNRLGFGGTAIERFHFRNNETEDMLVYQSNPEGVELFS